MVMGRLKPSTMETARLALNSHPHRPPAKDGCHIARRVLTVIAVSSPGLEGKLCQLRESAMVREPAGHRRASSNELTVAP
jgi:hypothetical protein